MNQDDIQLIFFQECDEGLTSAETGLIGCQSNPEDSEAINSIFRAVHSIKGGAGAFGFTALQQFTHKFETVLAQVRDGDKPLTAPLLATLFRAFDLLADHVSAIRGECDTPDDAEMSRLLEQIAESDAAPGEEGAASMDEDPVAMEIAPPVIDGLDFDLDGLLDSLGQDDCAVADEPVAKEWLVTVRPLSGALTNGSEPLLLLRELTNLGARCDHANLDDLPDLDAFDPEAAYLEWHYRVPASVERSAIADIFDFIGAEYRLSIEEVDAEPTIENEDIAPVAPPAAGPVATEQLVSAVEKTAEPVSAPLAAKAELREIAPAPQAGQAAKAGQTIRVDLEKLDRLVNTVGELVITQAMLAQQLSMQGISQIAELADLDHLTRELQDCAMSIRAQPIRSVFSRVPRIVRELETETGKRVRLDVDGEGTELDKTVVERIGEPLTHLIRNAIDHGLETPDEREAAGKSPEGVVRLTAEHRGGRILICVSDDGRGINRERVYAKAIERGLIAPDAILSDEEIDNLIFAPGFSTAQVVSNISGRGVGMDVVKQNVQALGGRISISSRPGHGSVFTLALPLTLAIADGMIVGVGEETLVVPLTHIVESLRPQPHEVRRLGGGKCMLNVRGQFLPVQHVGSRLGIGGGVADPTEAVLIVVESETAGHSVLMVDAIKDQRQVVIKSLETNFQQIDGVAGATILGDGRVALILDVESVVASELGRSRLAEAA
ncbi:chemotaxis protein CheA [Rhizorhapis sp. SPR117]|uniref:chemotaxis protein CheA n=1 Tax=Rhizorhapis sp. SPR117 TaxID=2912611 RepID=UPI001F19D62F|nr:chemotaxis protein CheA [Rhizorhapis sp. SPR117]